MMRGSRKRQIGWIMVLSLCVLAYLVLSFHVGSIKSQVHLAERDIIALERERIILETEFQTRANQQQLADWNRIEYGYHAPRADQYLETERQLASLGEQRAFDAPDPIRVAQNAAEADDGLIEFVSPITGKPIGSSMSGNGAGGVVAAERGPARVAQGTGTSSAATQSDGAGANTSTPASLTQRLSRESLRTAPEAPRRGNGQGGGAR